MRGFSFSSLDKALFVAICLVAHFIMKQPLFGSPECYQCPGRLEAVVVVVVVVVVAIIKLYKRGAFSNYRLCSLEAVTSFLRQPAAR